MDVLVLSNMSKYKVLLFYSSPAASATSRKRSEAPGLQLFCVTEERERAGRSRGWQERSPSTWQVVNLSHAAGTHLRSLGPVDGGLDTLSLTARTRSSVE